MAVLALAAALAHVLALDLVDAAAERLAVRHLRLSDVGLHLELALHAVHDDLEVKLAHAADDGLVRLLVRAHPEGRILFRKALQGRAHALLILLGLGLDGDVDHRLGEGHRLEHDRVVRVGTACRPVRRVLEAHGRGDVAGANLVDRLAVVRVHQQDAADALVALLGGVVDIGARL